MLRPRRQAARHPGHRDRHRPRHGRARLRPAVAATHRRAGAPSPSSTGSRASPAMANWWPSARSRCSKSAAPRAAAAGRFPAGDGRGRSNAGAAGARRMCGGAKRVADLFCGIGPFALAAGRASARHRRRQRCGRASRRCKRAAAKTPGLKPVEAQRARSVSPAVDGRRTQRLRRRGVRSAAAGRRGAGARTGRERGAGRGRGVLRSRRPSRAMRESWSTAAIGSTRSRRSTSSAIRPTSRSWRNHDAEPTKSAHACGDFPRTKAPAD